MELRDGLESLLNSRRNLQACDCFASKKIHGIPQILREVWDPQKGVKRAWVWGLVPCLSPNIVCSCQGGAS